MPSIKNRNKSENVSNRWSLWSLNNSFRFFRYLLRSYFSLVFLYKKAWKCWTFLIFLIKPSELQVQTGYSITQKTPPSQNHAFHSTRRHHRLYVRWTWMVRIVWKWWGFLKMLCVFRKRWWLKYKGVLSKVNKKSKTSLIFLKRKPFNNIFIF